MSVFKSFTTSFEIFLGQLDHLAYIEIVNCHFLFTVLIV